MKTLALLQDRHYTAKGKDNSRYHKRNNKTDGKTYVQNNLGKYERYGVYEKVTSLTIKQATGTQEVDYISAPDGAYIDLGYAPNSNTRIEAVYESTDGPDWKALYGTRFEANTQNDVEFPGITGSWTSIPAMVSTPWPIPLRMGLCLATARPRSTSLPSTNTCPSSKVTTTTPMPSEPTTTHATTPTSSSTA